MQFQHYRFPRVTINPEMCFGKPCIRGMRMPVASILEYLAGGMNMEQILLEFPFLQREDIVEALAYQNLQWTTIR